MPDYKGIAIDLPQDYLNALGATLRVEGRYSDHESDPGGETMFGISKRWHPEMWQNGRPTMEGAIAFYCREFWVPMGLAEIDSPELQAEIFDSGVNCGPGDGIRFSQQAFNLLRPDDFRIALLIEDGALGPKTAHALNSFMRANIKWNHALVNAANYFQGKHYEALDNRDMLRGWFANRIAFLPGPD